MSQDHIYIQGASENNLKNIDVKIPINQISCVGGRSGSGKSSLIFSTLYNESKRVFLNSLPTSAQLFAKPPSPAKVESIHPILPVVGLKQKNPIKGKRLCVSDLTGIGDLLEGLYETESVELCPEHGSELKPVTKKQLLIDFIIKNKLHDKALNLLITKVDYVNKFGSDFFPARTSLDLDTGLGEFDQSHEYWEFSRVKVNKEGALKGSLDTELLHEVKSIYLYFEGSFSSKLVFDSGGYKCEFCDYHSDSKFNKHRFFSAFSPLGACNPCRGFGSTLEYTFDKLIPNTSIPPSGDGIKFLTYKRVTRYYEPLLAELKKAGLDPDDKNIYKLKKFSEILFKGQGKFPGINTLVTRLEKKIYKMNVRVFLALFRQEVECSQCHGTRIAPKRYNFFVDSISINQLLSLRFSDIEKLLKTKKNTRNWKNVYDLSMRACDLGLGHLQVKRKALSLSSSEHQRCLLLNNLSFKGAGCLFIFDEPSLGLGVAEQQRFYKYLENLKENQNTVVVIDHSDIIKELSDYYLEIGPGAGPDGGKVVQSGKFKKDKTLNLKKCEKPKKLKKEEMVFTNISVLGMEKKNLNFVKNDLNLAWGPNGSGKTAFLVHGIANYMSMKLGGDKFSNITGKIKSAKGINNVKDVLLFSPEFTKPSNRSTVATYLGFAPVVRKYFASLPMAKAAGFKDGHFSANSALGQCSYCSGQGYTEIDMHFLESIKITCEYCNGQRFKPEVLSVNDSLYNIFAAGNTSMSKLFERVPLTPKFKRIFAMVEKLSLSYLTLDRTMGSLSGGEFQRLRLIKHLEANLENNLVILENMSFGLSVYEIDSVLELLENMALKNTIIIIDHSPLVKNRIPNQLIFK